MPTGSTLPVVEHGSGLGETSRESSPEARAVAPFNIYQVELSSYCNMKCSYCPHPSMKRPKGNMSAETLARSIELIRSRGRSRIVLHHFGEPLLHPRLGERLRQVVASGLEMQLSTNGLLLERMWTLLTELDTPVFVMISIHQWVDQPESEYLRALEHWTREAEGTCVTVLPAYNLKGGRYTLHRWAEGQRQAWDVETCPFIEQNFGVVLWNGDIATCCVDHEGITARYNILEADLSKHVSRPWQACSTCDVGRLMVGERW